MPDDALLDAVNAARQRARPDAKLERQAEARFGAARRLAVYGSLAPGAVNHHVVAALRGTWRAATVHGDLRATGWGASLGYPALHWRRAGPEVPAMLLESDELPAAWPEIDAFEGDGYHRLLVPVVLPQEIRVIANLYAASRDE